MKVLAKLCALAAMFLACLAAAPVQAHTLSGTISDGSRPVPGVIVDALAYGTQTVVATSTTGADGHYSLSLAANTYDLRVTPPTGSGFEAQTIFNFPLSADRVYDIMLFSTQPGSLSGTILGRGGQPVPNATVYVNIGPFSEPTTTDAAGHYTIDAINGHVFLQIFGNGPTGVAPDSWYLERYDVVINGPTTFDLTLPVARLNGAVKYPDSTGASGAALTLSTFGFSPIGRFVSNTDVTTVTGGAYDVLLFSGTATGVATPPLVNPGVVAVSNTFDIAGDTTHDFIFGAAVTVQGTVRGRNGQGVPGATVFVAVGSSSVAVVTDSLGHYTLEAENGPAFVQVFGIGPAGVAPANYYYERSDATVSGLTTIDIDLPVVRVSGTVRNASSVPLPGASLSLASSASDTDVRLSSDAAAVSDGNGLYDTLVLAGSVDAIVTPPAGSNLTVQRQSFEATADIVQDFDLASTTVLSGTILGRNNQPVENAAIVVSAGSELAEGQTDEDGHYSITVPQGTVFFSVSGPGGPGGPGTFALQRFNLIVSGPTMFDVTLPVAELTGTVTDANGAPIPGIPLTASTFDFPADGQTASSSTATSGADATFTALLLTGDGTVTLTPFPESGFVDTLQTFTLPGDSTQSFVVQHAGVSPVITAGPVIVHLSDTSVSIGWTTNRASTSTVEFGPGGLTDSAGDATLTTDHLVTLTGLTPSTQYAFRVSSADPSVDPSIDPPAVSAQSTFTTPVSGDAGAPIITVAPVVSVGQTSAIVQWTTHEPASSIVEYGSPATTVDGDPGAFRVFHRVQITGLAPDTAYSAIVRSADPTGGETTSGVFTFHTLAAPDTAAPAITAGPSIVAVTDTRVVVEWTTNEPSTSGVSFNDGTLYDLVTDAALTRTHRMTLAGLAPGTLYHLRVSSTDAEGNGPTLSAAVDVTTSAAPDATAPSIAGVQVNTLLARSGAVLWTTDEPANAVIRYGLVSGAPDGAQGDLDLSGSHRQELNGLQPSSTYYFVVQSTDVAGNTSTSAEFSFTTPPAFVDMPPSKPTSLTGPPSPTSLATIHLTWNAATDDLGVTGYEIQRDGVAIGTVDAATLSFDDTTAGEGSHTYQVGALDAAGHETLSDPLVIVVERTPPVLHLPADIVANAVGATATVTFTVTATDTGDPNPTVVCTPVSGSAFPVGLTQVNCTATDSAGNSSSGSFTVTVRDVTGPVLTVPADITREATGIFGAVVTYTATAVDAVDGPVTPLCSPSSGSTFHLGTTTVSCTARDAANNATTKTFKIKVVDTTGPVITRWAPSQSVIWPPNHKLVPLFISVTVNDSVDFLPICRITSIRSNEPVGNEPDWVFLGLLFAVRAERINTRIYTIEGECRDFAGNVSTASTTVTVPHNQ